MTPVNPNRETQCLEEANVQHAHDQVVDAKFKFVGLMVLSVAFTGFLLSVAKI